MLLIFNTFLTSPQSLDLESDHFGFGLREVSNHTILSVAIGLRLRHHLIITKHHTTSLSSLQRFHTAIFLNYDEQ